MFAPALHTESLAPAAPRPLWVAAAVLGLAFFLSEHDWTKSRLENFALSDQDMAASVEGGAANRQVAFLAVGGLGLLLLGNTTFLALGQGRTLSFRNSAAVLALGYAAWCVASVAWSVETALTAKRLAVLILCLVGVLGVCRHLGGRDLCTLALLLTSGFALIGIAAELSLGTFRPWAGDYRFGGTVHPNAQGVYCAVICLAATCKALQGGLARGWYFALAAVGAALLLLTKSRAALAGLAVALAALWLVRASAASKLRTAVVAILVVSSLLWAASLLGVDATSEIADAVLLGRSDDAESFSGRVPLWGELLTYAFQRPLCGYGYDAFWTPARVEDVSAFAGWTVPSAHSAYIDTLLSVGFVGAALLAAFAATALCGAVRRYAVGGDPGMAFILGLLVLGLINATMESGFVQPVCISFIAACGAGRLAFCREEMV